MPSKIFSHGELCWEKSESGGIDLLERPQSKSKDWKEGLVLTMNCPPVVWKSSTRQSVLDKTTTW